MGQQEIAELVTVVAGKATYFVMVGVVAFLLGLAIKHIGTLVFVWINIAFSGEQGSREHDLVERGGQIYEITKIKARVSMQNIDNPDDQRHIPLIKYWEDEIHSVECKQAYRDLRTNKIDRRQGKTGDKNE